MADPTPTDDAWVLHAADLHLGAPLDSLGAHIGDERAAHLRDLARRALDRLVDAAIARGVSVAVLAGDVYDAAHREVGAQLRLHQALARLTDHGIRVFIAHGNHDPVVGEYLPVRALPPGVTVFEPGAPQDHPVELPNGAALAVAGVSFARAAERENLARRFTTLPADPARVRVGVLHANVEGITGHDPYAPCSPADLAAAPVQYWALGHVHQRTVASLGPGRWWAYSGNLQGRSARATECGPKGVLLVPVGRHGVGEPEFVACDAIRFERADVDAGAAPDLGTVLDRLGEAARAHMVEAEGRPLLLRARLTGATAVHAELLRHRDALLELAREELGGGLGDGALLKVEVATRPEISREELLGRGDLLAALLTRLDELRADPEAHLDAALPALGLTTAEQDLLARTAADERRGADLLDEVERLLVAGLADGP